MLIILILILIFSVVEVEELVVHRLQITQAHLVETELAQVAEEIIIQVEMAQREETA